MQNMISTSSNFNEQVFKTTKRILSALLSLFERRIFHQEKVLPRVLKMGIQVVNWIGELLPVAQEVVDRWVLAVALLFASMCLGADYINQYYNESVEFQTLEKPPLLHQETEEESPHNLIKELAIDAKSKLLPIIAIKNRAENIFSKVQVQFQQA
mmetsp:Transcript_37388/g.49259  ORF Transcript_37388/g.49259 Transcript_37388/m.49259 type:complete len:155 (-) Transcript_37388:190-654(-)